MNKRIPTYLQYDEATCTDITFSSDILDLPMEARMETMSKVKKRSMMGSKFRKDNLTRILNKIILSQARVTKVVKGVPRKASSLLRRKLLERKVDKKKKLLEKELKASGSFSTSKGFVEVCSEENCLEQFEHVSQ